MSGRPHQTPTAEAARRGTVLLFGATSAIARAVAGEFARRRYDLVLIGRDEKELGYLAADLRVRYQVRTSCQVLDVLAFDSHPERLTACLSEAGEAVAGAVLCFGTLGDAVAARKDFREARLILETNFTGCVSVLNFLASYFEARRKGFLCVLSSVAGDRGRQSNYLYGAAKGGLSLYLQGLRNRLFPSGVRVITVKAGFVDTKMTFGRPGLFLVATPEAVARGICRAIERQKDVVYLPWFWRPVMWVIRAVPEWIFKRLKL
jgi:decaprenylphospho-beta-D-erythro-pentofuranosid-2-ulose 2-reductase